MIPEVCTDTNPAAQTLHRNLYNQLGPNYKIVQYLKSPKKGSSDTALNGSIFWIQHKTQSLFLYLSDAPASLFDETTENNSDSIKSKLLHNPEFMALIRFQNRLLPPQLQAHKAHLTPLLMVFANVDDTKINIGIKSLGLYLLAKNKLACNKLRSLVDTFMGNDLSEASRHHLRSIFNPELTINSHQVDNYLLDNEQEIAIKNDILLTDDKTRDKHLNLRGVNGCMNSGKSEVILQRSRLLNQTTAQTNDNKKVLILTPNNVSQLSLSKRYFSLHPSDKQTEILSLEQWCSQLLNTTKKQVDEEQISGLVDQLISKELDNNNISLTLFFQEVNFILGRTLFNRNDYLNATRKFQTSCLDDNQRKMIWKTLLIIKKELELNNSLLNLELPQLLWASIQSKNTYEYYDHILLDDAHLFSPIAFDLIKKLIKPKIGQLFITQNPNQLLLNSCHLWQETGLELRGHSVRLLNNYEINPYILNAASSFYLHRLPNDANRTIHRNLPDNPMPTLLHFHSHRDEDNRLLNKARTLINNGATPEDILLISTRSNLIPHYEKIFKQTLNISTTVLKGNNQQQNGIGLCSLHHAHGQKASYVFIVGIHHIYDDEKQSGLGTDEYVALHRDNTNKITAAMACANKELTLFLTSELIPRDFINPHIDIPSMSSETYAEVHALHA